MVPVIERRFRDSSQFRKTFLCQVLPGRGLYLAHGGFQGPDNFACSFGVGWSVQNFRQLRFASAFVIVRALVFAAESGPTSSIDQNETAESNVGMECR